MARSKGKRKPPSRKRYEEEHKTRSCRLTRDENRCLDKLLEGTGFSFGDFVRSWLGEEESLIKKRVEVLAKKKVPPVGEERLRCLEALMFANCIQLRDHDWSPYCPRCGDQELLVAWGDEIGSTGAHQETPTLKCPKCGYFLDTLKGIDPKSLEWHDPSAAEAALKPEPPPKKKKR
jgi:hypothetical protein